MQVTGVRSNVAAFNELFGNKGFTLAVRSDLSVAMDMLCKMTGTQTVAARASSDEIFNGVLGVLWVSWIMFFFVYLKFNSFSLLCYGLWVQHWEVH